MTHRFYDLGSLAKELLAKNVSISLARKIEGVKRLSSIRTDLQVAADNLRIISASFGPKESGSLDIDIIRSALLNNAILYYARATKTKSENRANYDIRHSLDDDQKKVHTELVDLRDKSIAHHGNSQTYEGVWQSEHVWLHAAEKGERVITPIGRQSWDKKLTERALKLVDTALSLVDAKAKVGISELENELRSALKSSEGHAMLEALERHHFDPNDVMGDDRVRDVLSSLETESGLAKILTSWLR